jgi:hypothetical protein
MKANPSPMSVADYCQDCNNKKIIVNNEYQRKEGLWTSQARSFFIESILLEYPIPKLYLYSRLDLKSRQTIKEIVDGQQRTQALLAFYNDKHRLTNNIETTELRGLTYSQLPADWQTRFLSYSLPIDQFVGAPEDEVREAFRRMNANNVPLNDEEQRNARFQGPFKWFIISIAEQFKEAFFKAGLFSRRDLMRMSDLKFYADIVLTLDSGFQTVKGKQIDDIYMKYNSSFSKEESYRSVVEDGLQPYFSLEIIQRPEFMKAHIFQSVVLAIIALRHGGSFNIQADEKHHELAAKIRNDSPTIDTLASALVDPEAHTQLNDFIQACAQKTNVEKSKVTRFFFFREALRPVL